MSCKLSASSSKESEDWLGDWYKEMKLHDFLLIKIKKKKISILVDNEHQLISKQVNFYDIHKHHLLLLDASLALNRLYLVIARFLSSSAVVESRYVCDI